MSNSSTKILYTISVIIGILAALVFLYPSLADAWNRYENSITIEKYKQEVAKDQEDNVAKEVIEAQKYNQELYERSPNNVGDFTYRLAMGERDATYESLLSDTSMMAYIEIPKIDVQLSIRHYTDQDVLKDSVGHLYGTSLPVGGPSTHAAITAHNALVTARLFTDLDQLEIGDQFSLIVRKDRLNYEVDQIKTVLPHELKDLTIEEGKDLVTLITCTPYGVNTHRLLVRARRIEGLDPSVYDQASIGQLVRKPLFIFVLLGLVLFLGLILIIRIWTKKPRR